MSECPTCGQALPNPLMEAARASDLFFAWANEYDGPVDRAASEYVASGRGQHGWTADRYVVDYLERV